MDMENALVQGAQQGQGRLTSSRSWARASSTYDIRGALAWALERREFLDAYNLGVANLSEARENLTIFNELAHGEEARA